MYADVFTEPSINHLDVDREHKSPFRGLFPTHFKHLFFISGIDEVWNNVNSTIVIGEISTIDPKQNYFEKKEDIFI
jgi:hypothetical protein